MTNALCELLGIEIPLVAFSHARDVVAAVSQAGAFGVLGISSHRPEELEAELRWLEERLGDRPYGVDLMLPERAVGKGEDASGSALAARIPPEHVAFVRRLLAERGIPDADLIPPEAGERARRLVDERLQQELLDVAFAHRVRFVASALGVPPPFLIERAHRAGVPVGALVGSSRHAVRQVEAGVDILIAESYEAGGHTGDIGGMVLVPTVIAATRPIRRVPVLAAGGIVTGRQMLAAMALGADGVWTGTVWLLTPESETTPTMREKLIEASASDTVRSRTRTGKPARQLRTAWHDAWEAPGSPAPLPMPLQSILTGEAFRRIRDAAARGNPGARELESYFCGQGVELLRQVRPARQVVEDFVAEFAAAWEELAAWVDK